MTISALLTIGTAAEPDLKTVLQRRLRMPPTTTSASPHSWLRSATSSDGADATRRAGADAPAVYQERVLTSEYVIVRDFAGSNSWLGVRDVYEVDGEPVNADRTRLPGAARRHHASAGAPRARARRLQAKYNLGDLYRTINVPTLRARVPAARSSAAVPIQAQGTTDLPRHSGLDRHLRRARAADDDPDTRRPRRPSSGSFWIDPSTGAVLRTELRAGHTPAGRFARSSSSATRRNERFDMLLPDDMNELYITGRTRIEGHATYTNFRRFETEVRIK